MRIVQIQAEDELFDRIGEEAIASYLEAQISILKPEPYLEHSSQAIKSNKIEVDNLLEEAKRRAWNKYQKKKYPYLS